MAFFFLFSRFFYVVPSYLILAHAHIRHESTRKEHTEILLAINFKARTVVGRGEKGPLCDPGSEILLGGSARVARIIFGRG